MQTLRDISGKLIIRSGTTRTAKRRGNAKRQGYALLACLLTIAVSSAIVVSLFNAQRVQCAEATARRQLVVIHSLQQAAQEHALAVLIDQPTFRGQLGPFTHPSVSGCSYRVQVVDAMAGNAGDVQVNSLVQINGRSSSASIVLSYSALSGRRAQLGL